MSKKFSKDPLRGMDDYYPEDLREINWIIDNIRDVVELYGYEEFEAPLIEPIEIFAAKSSDELVNEQSFIVEKKKGERLILIPELTPSLARMIARRSQELKKPIRWYSVPTCFRYERPQRGRKRSFKQVNVDILGENSLFAELEIFNIVVDIFRQFGANEKQFQILYNNRRFIDKVCELIIGISNEKLPLVYKILDKSNKLEEGEFEKYVLDNFQEEHVVQGIYKLREAQSIKELLDKFDNIPKEFYETKGYLELKEFEELLSNANISKYCSFSSAVVRGLDYYTGIVFEVYDTGKENKRSIFGGGRYDDLLSLFSDEKISGIGFGMGVLMLSLFLKAHKLIPDDIREKDNTDTIYIASINKEVVPYTLKVARLLREEDFPCIVDYRFKNLKNQLSRANDLGVLITLIIGPNEMKQEVVTIRNMKTENQKVVPLSKLINEIYEIIDEFSV